MPDDVTQLAALAAATFPLACPAHVTRDAITHYIAQNLTPAHFSEYLASPERTLLLACHDGTLAGYSMTVRGTVTEAVADLGLDPLGEINKIYVLPAAQGSGVAGSLLRHTLDAARADGVAAVWLGTNSENVRAQKFYCKNGFDKVGTKQFSLGGRQEHDYVYLHRWPD